MPLSPSISTFDSFCAAFLLVSIIFCIGFEAPVIDEKVYFALKPPIFFTILFNISGLLNRIIVPVILPVPSFT